LIRVITRSDWLFSAGRTILMGQRRFAMTATTLDRPQESAVAPLSFDTATLVVRDLDRMTRYYADELAFSLLRHDAASATLGAGNRALLHLRRDPHAQLANPAEAGLFHLAWLLPSRLELARWALRACANGVALSGSDHIVSEALYLSDPEGNGIEVYADRDPSMWDFSAGHVKMATRRLDLRALAASAEGECAPVPEGTVLGHVHLKVGAIAPAETFWTEALGMGVTARYGAQAVFMAAGHTAGGRYHHHVAANNWDSAGSGPREPGRTGLDHFVVRAPHLAAGERVDPWGNRAVVIG
jgi:catechol 2,3-dioxygenase